MKRVAAETMVVVGIVLLIMSMGCVGSLDQGPTPEPEDPSADPRPDDPDDPTDQPEPAELTANEVGAAFDSAVLSALSQEVPGIAVDKQNVVTLTGVVQQQAGQVEFDQLNIGKAPFAISGTARVSMRDQLATIRFTNSATGIIESGGVDLGSFLADFPSLPDFSGDAADLMLGEAIDCQGIDVADLFNGVPVSGSCTVEDGDGNVVANIDIDNLGVDPAALGLAGDITLTADGVLAELSFDGLDVELIVNGEVVGDFSLGDLIDI
jgi:hypothetical protein